MSSRPGSGVEPLNVLLVEDNEGDATLVRKALRQDPVAYRVRTVDRLSLALEAAKEGEDVDVILLDLGLPDSAGVETVARLREAWPGMPIVVLTVADALEVAQECLAVGAQDYLAKADVTPQLLSRVIGYSRSRIREAEVREARIRQLRRAVRAVEGMASSSTTTGVTAAMSGNHPLASREPATFEALRDRYRRLLGAYIEAQIREREKPRRRMERLVTEIGDLGCGPRDLIDLHLAALELAHRGASPARAEYLGVEGRLLALEMMGLLVDYYRLGLRTEPLGDHH